MKRRTKFILAQILSLCFLFNIFGQFNTSFVLAITSSDYSTDNAGIEFLKEHEGLILTAYKAVGTEKYYTIGYGHYGSDVYAGMKITEAEAERLLRIDLLDTEIIVRNQTYGINMTQSQFNALVSLCYNTGGDYDVISDSPLVAYLRGDLTEEQAKYEYSYYYVSSDGYYLQGLVNRRNDEAALFFKEELTPAGPGHVMDESEAAGQTIPDGTYWMVSRLQSNFAIDIPGTSIMSETCNVGMHIFGGGSFEKYDAWDFKYLGNGFYRIRQHDSKMCLDSEGGTLKQYSNVILYADNGSNAQQWSVERHTAGYKIRCRCSSHLLNVVYGKIENETNVCTWPEDGMNEQYWNLIPYVDTSKEASIKEGTYTFSSKDKTDWYMVAEGKSSSYATGTNLQISSQNKDSFEIESASYGYYKIKETTSGLYVAAIKSDNFWDRRNVGLETSSNSRAQLWAIKKNSDDTYYVINKLNGFYLDVNSSSYSEGININEIPLNKDSCFKQKWNISDAIKPTGIKLTSTPTKKTYYEHEKLDTTGLKVTATFDNGTTKDVTADVKFKYDFSTAGETTVTVSYTYAGITKTASYPVTITKIALLFKGEGTEKSPYLIGSKDALIQMCDLVNDSYYNATYGSAHYALTADIDLSGVTWVGIGLNEQPFLGTFDGRKHTVRNMTVNAKKKFAGFFGKVNGTAVIENLSVEGTVTNTDRSTGGIVGEIGNSTDGLIVTIRNCSFIGNVSGDLTSAGGIVGCAWQNGIVTDCYHIGTVTSKSGYAGGIVGYTEVGELKNNAITIANSYHVGKITGNGGTIVGRTVGNATNGCKITLKNCYALTADGGYAYTPDTKTMDVQQLKSGSLLNAAASEISENMVKNTKPSELNAGYPVFWWQNVTVGDCNADGEFTIADAVTLQKWLLAVQCAELTNWQAADICEDSVINTFDLVMMKRMLINK